MSSLLLPSASKLNLDIQYRQYDQLGVPYTVVLNENTLKNGIIQLRNRDTTLKVCINSVITKYDQIIQRRLL